MVLQEIDIKRIMEIDEPRNESYSKCKTEERKTKTIDRYETHPSLSGFKSTHQHKKDQRERFTNYKEKAYERHKKNN